MEPLPLFALQFTLSLTIASMAAKWYIYPALRRREISEALVPLFFVHSLRYLPSSGFAPGQLASDIPDAMATIAYGDLASAIVAIVAIVALRKGVPGAISIAWGANILMALDWLIATYLAATNELVTYSMGGNWYIIAYYVPLLAVVHVMIFARLVAERDSATPDRHRQP